ncbi:UDP-glucose 4-epimerase [Vibrio ishigakensis]|uniref:UDP-glucose 4-epimerase n=1 Tax=Vibrio ishigakensis TaxID=1481914 RepID=A0A0B8NZT0_9VIBR|nr:UDP-glucose 4-epimerase [Vibrio ishigakensis]
MVHCSALVHQMDNEALYSDYYDTNVLGTENLARQAADNGAKRFVFLSSVKVNGEYSAPNHPFKPDVDLAPDDFYGKSKYEAELRLRKVSEETGMEVVIIRPPLVYGPGVKANFLTLMKWTSRKLPLPFGSIDNRRSLVYVENLVDLVLNCCTNPQAAGKTFLVSDNHDVSTRCLLRSIAKSMKVKSYLVPVPRSIFKLAATVFRKPELEVKLFGFLQVDISETRKVLGWEPPYSFEEGIQKTVDDFLANKNS